MFSVFHAATYFCEIFIFCFKYKKGEINSTTWCLWYKLKLLANIQHCLIWKCRKSTSEPENFVNIAYIWYPPPPLWSFNLTPPPRKQSKENPYLHQLGMCWVALSRISPWNHHWGFHFSLKIKMYKDAIAVKFKMYKCCLIIGMTQAFLKPLSWNESQSIGKSLKKERNWCLNHVNILSGSKVVTKNRHQNMYICIFFGPIYQNGHQIVTTSSPLLALKTGISYPPPPPFSHQLRKKHLIGSSFL